MTRTKVAEIKQLPPGSGTSVDAGGRTLALFNVDGTLYALDNTCPHRGGPLGEGDLDGAIVTCPWHGWRYDVTTGAHDGNTSVRAACYPVTVEHGSPTWISESTGGRHPEHPTMARRADRALY